MSGRKGSDRRRTSDPVPYPTSIFSVVDSRGPTGVTYAAEQASVRFSVRNVQFRRYENIPLRWPVRCEPGDEKCQSVWLHRPVKPSAHGDRHPECDGACSGWRSRTLREIPLDTPSDTSRSDCAGDRSIPPMSPDSGCMTCPDGRPANRLQNQQDVFRTFVHVAALRQRCSRLG